MLVLVLVLVLETQWGDTLDAEREKKREKGRGKKGDRRGERVFFFSFLGFPTGCLLDLGCLCFVGVPGGKGREGRRKAMGEKKKKKKKAEVGICRSNRLDILRCDGNGEEGFFYIAIHRKKEKKIFPPPTILYLPPPLHFKSELWANTYIARRRRWSQQPLTVNSPLGRYRTR
jgi:hypothetical protein